MKIIFFKTAYRFLSLHNLKNHTKGFTLFELLVVITIIGLLSTIAVVVLNPGRRFAEARNTSRIADVNSLLSALKIFQTENLGQLPQSLETIADGTYEISNSTGVCTTSSCTHVVVEGCVSLDELVVDGYIPELPIDPNGEMGTETGYYITKEPNGILRIGSCESEEGAVIQVSR